MALCRRGLKKNEHHTGTYIFKGSKKLRIEPKINRSTEYMYVYSPKLVMIYLKKDYLFDIIYTKNKMYLVKIIQTNF